MFEGPHPFPLRIQKHMQSIFMSFRQSSLISLRLSLQPHNACRRPVLYGSIKILLLFAGEVKCGKCDVYGLRVVQAQCFQMTFVGPLALCFTTATYIHTSISATVYVLVGDQRLLNSTTNRNSVVLWLYFIGTFFISQNYWFVNILACKEYCILTDINTNIDDSIPLH